MTSLITSFTELVLCIDLLDCVLLILQRIGTFQQYCLKSSPMHDATAQRARQSVYTNEVALTMIWVLFRH
jgi:hypothetical protein